MQRREYVIDKDVNVRAEAETVCAAVIEVLRPVVCSAQIDVFTDFPRQMPEDVRRAEAQLVAAAKCRKRGGSDGRMGPLVNADDPEWSAVESHAAWWSINADLAGPVGEDLTTFYDCWFFVVAVLTERWPPFERASGRLLQSVCSATFRIVVVRRSAQHGAPDCAPG